jgi:hypothetical protein
MNKIVYILIGLVILSGVLFVVLTPKTGTPITPVDETPTTTDDGRVRAPEDVTLSIGETGDAAGLTVVFNKITSDSRCPVDVQCIWEGTVSANVTLERGGEKTTLDIAMNESAITFAGYSVSLASVLPATKSTTPIDPTDYRVTFQVGSVLGNTDSIPANIYRDI